MFFASVTATRSMGLLGIRTFTILSSIIAILIVIGKTLLLIVVVDILNSFSLFYSQCNTINNDLSSNDLRSGFRRRKLNECNILIIK